MKCTKCSNNLYVIENLDCEDCIYNGAYDSELKDYTTDSKIIEDNEMMRNQVEDEGECYLGDSYGHGCYLFTCSICNQITNIALVEKY